MAITNAQATTLNNAMVANQRVSLGTIVQGLQTSVSTLEGTIVGTHTVTAGEETANEAAIDTGVATVETGFIVQIFRAGVNVMNDAVVTLAAGVLTVADGGATYSVTEDDVINYIVY